MKAVIIKEHGVAAVADIKEQAMQPDYIRVKTVALAVNPTDLHHTAGGGRVGGIVGCDLAGIVDEVGEECKSDFKKGDAVYGVCHGANLVSDYVNILLLANAALERRVRWCLRRVRARPRRSSCENS